MTRRILSREFKVEAVRLVKEHGSRSRKRAEIWTDMRNVAAMGWELTGDPAQAFPGQGQQKPEQLEINRGRPSQGSQRKSQKNFQTSGYSTVHETGSRPRR